MVKKGATSKESGVLKELSKIKKRIEVIEDEIWEELERTGDAAARGAQFINHVFNGLVVNEELAKRTPCQGYEIKPGKFMMYSPGIIGTLKLPDQEWACNPRIIHEEVPEKLQKRMTTFSEASKACKIGQKDPVTGKTTTDFVARVQCMSRALKKEGIEV